MMLETKTNWTLSFRREFCGWSKEENKNEKESFVALKMAIAARSAFVMFTL